MKRLHCIKVRGYVTRVKVWNNKVYSISKRLHINNHRYLFYINIIVFEIRRHLATYHATWQQLPVNIFRVYTSFIWLFVTHFLCFGIDVPKGHFVDGHSSPRLLCGLPFFTKVTLWMAVLHQGHLWMAILHQGHFVGGHSSPRSLCWWPFFTKIQFMDGHSSPRYNLWIAILHQGHRKVCFTTNCLVTMDSRRDFQILQSITIPMIYRLFVFIFRYLIFST